MKLGENIQKIRLQTTKYSQKEMADFLGVDRNTYANWERGENDVKSEYIPKLADLLNVSIEELFNNEKRGNLSITYQHNEGKESSVLNGAVIVITDKNAISQLADIIKDNISKK